MDVRFKPAELGDLEGLVGQMRELYALERFAFDEAAARAARRSLLGDARRGLVWLIVADGETVGYAALTFGFSLEYHGRDAFVDEIFVRADRPGRGIGSRALDFLKKAARAHGAGALHLEVECSNARARELYLRSGFVDQERFLMTHWIDPRLARACSARMRASTSESRA
jgi:ribosomal protein S18 acetylase RimI-like enzyme